MLRLSAYSCREAFLINYIIKKLEKCKKWPENGLEKCIKLAVFTLENVLKVGFKKLPICFLMRSII